MKGGARVYRPHPHSDVTEYRPELGDQLAGRSRDLINMGLMRITFRDRNIGIGG